MHRHSIPPFATIPLPSSPFLSSLSPVPKAASPLPPASFSFPCGCHPSMLLFPLIITILFLSFSLLSRLLLFPLFFLLCLLFCSPQASPSSMFPPIFFSYSSSFPLPSPLHSLSYFLYSTFFLDFILLLPSFLFPPSPF